ncbi:MAG: bifunctional nuclease family protein [Anaerolineales bacterium]
MHLILPRDRITRRKGSEKSTGEYVMSDMVEVVIDSIRVSLMSQQRVIILREVGSERYLPIMVGIYEAEHLTLAMQNVEVSRPLTYDLFVNMLETLGAEVIHVEVVALREETYYGNIVVNINGTMHNIDSRPSDAMNLAVRLDVPIFASREVLDEAGLVPEEDLSEEGLEGETEVESERLSVFEDYLDQIKGEGGSAEAQAEGKEEDEEEEENEAPDEEDEGEEE